MDDQAPVVHVRVPTSTLEDVKQALGLDVGTTRAALTRAAFAYITGKPAPFVRPAHRPRKLVSEA
jgi:hypothetical protein